MASLVKESDQANEVGEPDEQSLPIWRAPVESRGSRRSSLAIPVAESRRSSIDGDSRAGTARSALRQPSSTEASAGSGGKPNMPRIVRQRTTLQRAVSKNDGGGGRPLSAVTRLTGLLVKKSMAASAQAQAAERAASRPHPSAARRQSSSLSSSPLLEQDLLLSSMTSRPQSSALASSARPYSTPLMSRSYNSSGYSSGASRPQSSGAFTPGGFTPSRAATPTSSYAPRGTASAPVSRQRKRPKVFVMPDDPVRPDFLGAKSLYEQLAAKPPRFSNPTRIQTQLLQACATNDVHSAARLLDTQGASVACNTPYGVTPLHYAVNIPSMALLKLIMRQKPEDVKKIVNQFDSTGFSPLMLAVRSNLVEMAVQLLKYGADPNLKDPRGSTCLHLAARGSNAEMLIELLNHGGDPMIEDREGRSTLLFVSQDPALAESANLLPKIPRADWFERMAWNHEHNEVYHNIPKTPRQMDKIVGRDELSDETAIAWGRFMASYQDVNGAQVISKTLLRTQSNVFSKRQLLSIEHEFKAADKDGKGRLDRREFGSLIMTLLRWKPVNSLVFQTAISELFDSIDFNNNGFLELDEVLRLYGVMFQREHQEPSLFTRPESRYGSRPASAAPGSRPASAAVRRPGSRPSGSRGLPNVSQHARRIYKDPSVSLMDNPQPKRDLGRAAAEMAVDPRGFLERSQSMRAHTHDLALPEPVRYIQASLSASGYAEVAAANFARLSAANGETVPLRRLSIAVAAPAAHPTESGPAGGAPTIHVIGTAQSSVSDASSLSTADAAAAAHGAYATTISNEGSGPDEPASATSEGASSRTNDADQERSAISRTGTLPSAAPVAAGRASISAAASQAAADAPRAVDANIASGAVAVVVARDGHRDEDNRPEDRPPPQASRAEVVSSSAVARQTLVLTNDETVTDVRADAAALDTGVERRQT